MALPAVLQHLTLPVIASPMFIVSYPELVLAQCKAGIVGSFPALNARPAELLDEWLTQIQAELADHRAKHPDAVIGPIAVNQIVHQSNARLEHDVRVCVDHKVPIFITSLRAPAREIVDAVHSYGGIVLHDVINQTFARKAIERPTQNNIELPPVRIFEHPRKLGPLVLAFAPAGVFDVFLHDLVPCDSAPLSQLKQLVVRILTMAAAALLIAVAVLSVRAHPSVNRYTHSSAHIQQPAHLCILWAALLKAEILRLSRALVAP